MKACIVTVYNSENCGSYWQAYALKTFVESLGFQVLFLKRNLKGSSHSFKTVFRHFLREIKKRKIKSAFGKIKQYRTFNKDNKVFNTINDCDESFDVCILGSDTIWNLNSNYFAKERMTYWGKKSKAHITITYAASLANTSDEKIDKYPEVISYLDDLNAVSVRDQHTKDILSKYTDKKMNLVCDPTLLFDKTFYCQFCGDNHRGDFLFVYYFGRMPVYLEKHIKRFAKERKLRIVVMGDSMIGDEQIFAYSSYDFIECYCYAKYIVTNTFHGTIFSVIFEKNSLINSDGKKKVKDILDRFGLNQRDYSNGADLINDFELNDLDYSNVTCKALELRKNSIAYLKNAIVGDLYESEE